MLEASGARDEAEQVLNPWLKAKEILALDQRVRQLASRQEWSSAAESLLEMINFPQGKRTKLVEQLVTFYERGLKFEAAFKWIEEWKRMSPGSVTPWLRQAAMERHQDSVEKAIMTLRKASHRFDDNTIVLDILASYRREEGKPEEAERIYWNLYEESENISDKLKWAANLAALGEENGDTDQIIEKFEARRRSNRSSLSPLLALAEIHRRSRDSEKEKEILREATHLRPEDPDLLKAIAGIEEKEGDWEAAVETLKLALALPLDKTDATKLRIARLYLRFGDEDEGYRRLAELRGGNQMDADAVIGLAEAMVSRNSWEKSRDFLEEHRDRFPDDYRIQYLCAVALEETDNVSKAKEMYLRLQAQKKEHPGVTVTQSSQSNLFLAFYGSSPPGMLQLKAMSQYDLMAYQYRLIVPANLETLHRNSLSHIRKLSMYDSEEIKN